MATTKLGRPPRPAIDRFREKVLVDPNTGCHEWTAHRDKNGYGGFRDRGKPFRAARWIYEHIHGPIPDSLTIDHLCMNTGCVNPEHLEVVTMRVNVLRGNCASAQNARKTHCDRGHPLSGSNVHYFTSKNGSGVRRYCRTCKRDDSRVNAQKKRDRDRARLE